MRRLLTAEVFRSLNIVSVAVGLEPASHRPCSNQKVRRTARVRGQAFVGRVGTIHRNFDPGLELNLDRRARLPRRNETCGRRCDGSSFGEGQRGEMFVFFLFFFTGINKRCWMVILAAFLVVD